MPPPKDEQWTDDTNMETRIQPADPRIADEQPLDPRGPTAIQDVAAPVSNATASTVVANPDGTQRPQSVWPHYLNYKLIDINAENAYGVAVGRVVLEDWSAEDAVDELIERIKQVAGS